MSPDYHRPARVQQTISTAQCFSCLFGIVAVPPATAVHTIEVRSFEACREIRDKPDTASDFFSVVVLMSGVYTETVAWKYPRNRVYIHFVLIVSRCGRGFAVTFEDMLCIHSMQKRVYIPCKSEGAHIPIEISSARARPISRTASHTSRGTSIECIHTTTMAIRTK